MIDRNDKELLMDWNNTGVDYGIELPLHGLIEKQVSLYENSTALRFQDQSISYSELNGRANQVAHYLREIGMGPDKIVAVMMERSIDLIVVLLGILKSGSAYLPIDPVNPDSRCEYILNDSGAAVVITQSCFENKINEFEGTIFCLDSEYDYLLEQSEDNPELINSIDDLAYVIYTSGSTGKPKGCLLPHLAICNRLIWMRRQYDINSTDRILQKTPYTFDVSVWELFLPLLSGACLVITKPGGHKDAAHLAELIERESVTICHFVPSMLRLFLNQSNVTKCKSLKHVFASGEALTFNLLDAWMDTGLSGQLHNLYGPTEAAVDVSYWQCEQRTDKKIPIGKPIANIKLYILNENLEQLAIGEQGELYIGGVGLARGYLNRPTLTDEKFVSNPFADNPSEKLYKTGDLAKFMDGGLIEYIGRTDYQVKLRGNRIELTDIEENIRLHKDIKDVAVLVQDVNTIDPKLVAYIVSDNESLTTKSIRQYLKDTLPDYMIPNRVIGMDSLPLTQHGKVDRKSLPWNNQARKSEESFIDDKSQAGKQQHEEKPNEKSVVESIEKISGDLIRNIAEFLEVEIFDADEDLFDIGATSLTMAYIIEDIEKKYGVSIPVDVFLEEPSVIAITLIIQENGESIPAEEKAREPSTGQENNEPGLVDHNLIHLDQAAFNDDLYLNRITSRVFSGGKTPKENLGKLLSLLKERKFDGKSSFLYASAGGLNPVQTYLYVRNDAINGVKGGTYYYHPTDHTLCGLKDNVEIDSSIFNISDREALNKANFVLFFIVELAAIQPVYNSSSALLSILETGYIEELLISRKNDFNIELSPISGVDFDSIEELFNLHDSHRFLHAVIGGEKTSDIDVENYIETLPYVDEPLHSHCIDYSSTRTFSNFLSDNSAINGVMPTASDSDSLHKQQAHLRKISELNNSVLLDDYAVEKNVYKRRSCKREFITSPVTKNNLGKFISLLQPKNISGVSRYLYPSSTGHYNTKIYIFIKENAVEGVSEGLYLYDMKESGLKFVSALTEKKLKSCYTPFNRKNYLNSKFCIFLVSPLAELSVNYAEDSEYLALLEAGAMGQLLLDNQADFDMGVCPIGGILFDKVSLEFSLNNGDKLMHSFVCGGYDSVLENEIADKSNNDISNEIAITGVHAWFPGAKTLEQYSENLKNGTRSFKELLLNKENNFTRNFNEYTLDNNGRETDDQRYFGGFLEDIECFDSMLFKMSPAEARSIDPQERLLLQSVWCCLENSGYTADSLNKVSSKVGVFVGAMWDDYQHHGSNIWQKDAEVLSSSSHSSLANRISYFFNFSGPSVAVNTACSSAMTAIHYACNSIINSECDVAVVAGVNIMSHPYHHGMLKTLDLLSDQQQCHPFGAKADGWVAGEGVSSILIKSKQTAETTRDYIYGIIKGTAIGHTGKTTRFGAPSSRMQAESMRTALDRADVSTSSINYVEAAVPGAGLADATEVAAIQQLFDTKEGSRRVVKLGTVKANIGHLESASAMSQLTKVLLQMKLGKLFPTPVIAPIHPMIKLQNSVIEISEVLTDWEPPRRALINSFGATGSSGHLVVEEYISSRENFSEKDKPHLIIFSAASPKQIKEKVTDLIDFLDNDVAEAPSLGNVSYTLATGRVEMQHRLAVIANSIKDLISTLNNYITSSINNEHIFEGNVSNLKSQKGKMEELESRELSKLAEEWVKGSTINWLNVFNKAIYNRIPLPTYPFAKEKYWIKGKSENKHNSDHITQSNTQRVNSTRKSTIEYLQNVFSKITEHPISSLDENLTFDEFGLSSSLVTSINVCLEKDFGPLSKTLLFEYQTIADLANYFVTSFGDINAKLSGSLLQDTQSNTPDNLISNDKLYENRDKSKSAQSDIAIVGVAGRYPKSENLDAFWDNLKLGVDCISNIPSDRRLLSRLSSDCEIGKEGFISNWGGFIDGVDEFDPLFFKISPLEAEILDPQERLFLQTVWHTFEDAGYSRGSLKGIFGGRIGVYVGVMYGEYQLYSDAVNGGNKGNRGIAVGSSYGSIANRISYIFDCHGPSMAIDTLCSSSLTALHLAVESLKRQECKGAIVGGVNLSIHPNKYILHSQLTMSSSDGRCRSFGQGGDGFVAGEGVGSIFIRRADDAVANGDNIYALIKGTSINHDGKTHGYTVPNPNAQADMIIEAIQASGINPESVSYVEAHGTGTSLGDPIEVTGLTKAFSKYTNNKQYCAIGSVKSNIGHLEAAAGIAGITKIILQLKYRQLVPSLHAKVLNKNIDFSNTPFYVQQELSEWKKPCIEMEGKDREFDRIACLSSFGAGGSNAHAIIEEYSDHEIDTDEKNNDVTPDKKAYPIVFSARTEKQLIQIARSFQSYCSKELNNTKIRIADIAYTLQVGREDLEERLGFFAGSINDIDTILSNYLADASTCEQVIRSSVKSRSGDITDATTNTHQQNNYIKNWKDTTDAYSRDTTLWSTEGLKPILDLWLRGAKTQWYLLYEGETPRRLSLPVYPFAKDKYWVSSDEQTNGIKNTVESTIDGLSSARVATNSIVDEGSELLCFQEVLQESVLTPVGNNDIKTIVCFLSTDTYRKTWSDVLIRQNNELDIVFIEGGNAYDKISDQQYQVSTNDQESYRQALKEINRVKGNIDAIYYLWPFENEYYLTEISPIISIIKAINECSVKNMVLSAPYDTGLNRCHIDAWIGIAKSQSLMIPDCLIKVVMFSSEKTDKDSLNAKCVEQLWHEGINSNTESVLFKGNSRFTHRITPLSISGTKSDIKPVINGSVLVTGGAGGLGHILATHLAENYGVDLILTGRSAINKDISHSIEELKRFGQAVKYLQADVCNFDEMRSGLDRVEPLVRPICGIVHAAGVQDNQDNFNKTLENYKQTLAPKITGTMVLDRLFDNTLLDFVCYFSSSASILGDGGAGDYAMANRFQSTYAKYRQEQVSKGNLNGKTLLLGWPLWRNGGMGAKNDEEKKAAQFYLKTSGQRYLENEEALNLFDKLLLSDHHEAIIFAGKPSKINKFLNIEGHQNGQTVTVESNIQKPSPGHSGRRPELRGLSVNQCIRWEARNLVSVQLKIPKQEIAYDSDLSDYGFDSVSLARFARSLSDCYGVEITPAIFFGNSTIAKLADYLGQKFSTEVEAIYNERSISNYDWSHSDVSNNNAEFSENTQSGSKLGENIEETNIEGNKAKSVSVNEPIAIIGISGRFPNANNVDEMWDILQRGENAVEEIPSDRFDWRDYYSEVKGDSPYTTNCKWTGCIAGVGKFDALFFEISPREAEMMDPRQRLLLQESWNALEDAGYGSRQIGDSKIGVFVGAEEGEYFKLARSGDATSNHNGVLASRLSYFLDLKGPAMAINTACSSSLVATHQACLSLRNSECDTALAAGVNLLFTPDVYVGMSQAGMLSGKGKCAAFDKNADGMVPGEAVIAVVLKKLSRAIVDGDPIYASIIASGINYDGKTSGITSPSSASQSELIEDVYTQYDVNPQTIEYVVTHGTGTPLGDPVEINGLYDAFKNKTHKSNFCAITSNKTNFGHTFAASGLLNLVNLVQSFHHEEIPASLHCETDSDYIDWSHSPFYLNKERQPWCKRTSNPRRGAISSFGMSGTNAHMVLQEDTTAEIETLSYPCYLLVFSAKTNAALIRRREAICSLLEDKPATNLAALSYTLLDGRHHFRHRSAMIIYDVDNAISILQQEKGENDVPNQFSNVVARSFEGQAAIQEYGQEQVEKCHLYLNDQAKYQSVLSALAELYCQGYNLNWVNYFHKKTPRRIHLPTYSFSEEVHWLDQYQSELPKVVIDNVLTSSNIPADSYIKPDSPRHQEEILATNIRVELAGLNLKESLEWDLKKHISQVLKVSRETLERDAPLTDFGFDSFRLTELAKVLENTYGIEITPSVFFGYPTLEMLTDYFYQQYPSVIKTFYQKKSLDKPDTSAKGSISQEKIKPSKTRIKTAMVENSNTQMDLDDIAIIGMSGRFPQARNIDEMWSMLIDGKDAITEIPADRFDWKDYYSEFGSDSSKINCKWIGHVPGVSEFDPLFFEISPREAQEMDPGQRLLLQESWSALEDAGYGEQRLKKQRVGIFVGAEQDDYQNITGAKRSITSNHNGVMAARLAFFLNLNGPNMAINTACSSGLVAAHQAWLSLRSGECDVAMAAGVNLILTPQTYVGMARSGMLSKDGRCFTFDKRANGMVPGEAVAVVVLKRLQKAQEDNDSIYAVINGSGVNYDGRTNGITAPSGVGQVDLLKTTYQRFNIDPRNIDYIVTHGTGTKLGDPVEINALSEVFKEYTDKPNTCALTSTKTNFGHTFAASGLLSLIALTKSIYHKQIPASLNCENENDFIQWSESPFYVNKTLEDWPEKEHHTRMGSVSAFGISGTNAHMILSSYESAHREQQEGSSADSPFHMLTLSAHTAEALQQKVEDMLALLNREKDQHADQSSYLSDLSYTLLNGRHHFRFRCAIVVQDIASAIYIWKEFGKKEKRSNLFQGTVPHEFTGQVAMHKYGQELLITCQDHTTESNLYQESLYALADLYCQGYVLPWQDLFTLSRPKIIRLPGYPFARESFWSDAQQESVTENNIPQNMMRLHPLIHRNTSNFTEQKFTSSFSGREFFLADHRVNGIETLPAVAYLEMACAALQFSDDGRLNNKIHLKIKNVVWLKPFTHGILASDIYTTMSPENDFWVSFKITSGHDESTNSYGEYLHSQGLISRERSADRPHYDINKLLASHDKLGVNHDDFYNAYKKIGINYGPAHRAVRQVYRGDEQVIAEVLLNDDQIKELDNFVIHPGIIDAAFQLPIVLQTNNSANTSLSYAPWLPFAMDEIEIFNKPCAQIWVWARMSEKTLNNGTSKKFSDNDIQKIDIDLIDIKGHVCVSIRGLVSKKLDTPMTTRQITKSSNDNLVSTVDEIYEKSDATSVCHIESYTGSEYFLKDHHQILPAAVYLDLVNSVLNNDMDQNNSNVKKTIAREIRNITWQKPVLVSDKGSDVSMYLELVGDSQKISIASIEKGEKAINFQAEINSSSKYPDFENKTISLANIKSICIGEKNRTQCNTLLQSTHGPSIFSIENFNYSDNQAIVSLKDPAPSVAISNEVLNPRIVNGAIISSVILLLTSTGQEKKSNLPMPFALERCRIFREIPSRAYAHIRLVKKSDKAGVNKFDIDITDINGLVAVSFENFTTLTPQKFIVEPPVVLNTNDDAFFAHLVWKQKSLSNALSSTKTSVTTNMPMFVLPNDGEAMEASIKSQWPNAIVSRVLALDGSSLQSVEQNFSCVFSLLKRTMKKTYDKVQPFIVLVPEDKQNALYASLSSLLKTARSEQSKLAVKTIRYSLNNCDSVQIINYLQNELDVLSDDVDVRYRQDGSREVIAIEEIKPLEKQLSEYPIKHGGVIWITGGFGGLGKIFASHFGRQDSSHIVLTGRSAINDSNRYILDDLRSQGVSVDYFQADISKAEDIEKTLNKIEKSFGKLTGVIHSAGLIRDAYIVNKTEQELAKVLAPKVGGVIAIDHATRNCNLDFMVFFSSLSSVIGNPGQADYAGANNFLNIFASERNRWVEQGKRYGNTLSISWPLWKDGGMVMDHASEQLMKQRTGMMPMDTETGVKALDYLLHTGFSHVLVAQGDVEKIRSSFIGNDKKIPSKQKGDLNKSPSSNLNFTDERETSNTPDIDESVKRILTIAVSEQQQISPEKVEEEVAFTAYGFDSIEFTKFANTLNSRYSLELMPTIFFEYPSIKALSLYLVETYSDQLKSKLQSASVENENRSQVSASENALSQKETPSYRFGQGRLRALVSQAAPSPQERTIGRNKPIAIIGMSGRLPGSKDVNEFWSHLASNDDLVKPIPSDRWSWQDYYGDPFDEPGKTQVTKGGFIDGIDLFDPHFFGISPREAETMDPQFRILLETMWATIEDAGYRVSELAESKVGVFVGASSTDYKELWQSKQPAGVPVIFHFITANRISYLLNLRGPSEAIDTACSSSLIAVHRAMESFHYGSSESALVGGVNVIAHPNLTLVCSMAGMLSGDGRCKTFDKSADGYGRGEGVGAILLKPLNRAIEERDNIYGIIRGSAENHGGKAASPTAPNPLAQEDLLVEAYKSAGIDPATVSYIETHGTGTELGDPIEINGLKNAFSKLYNEHNLEIPKVPSCALGSVKANIGHLEAAAGISCVLKVLLMLKNKMIPGNVHLRDQNPYIKLEKTPFYLPKTTQVWDAQPNGHGAFHPRRAGVSSFGVGGANAHVVIEEYVQPEAAFRHEQDGQTYLYYLLNQLNSYMRWLIIFINS